MKNLIEKKKRSTSRSGWIPLVAVAAIALLVGMGLSAALFGREEMPDAALSAPVLQTATFTPTPLPTSTPILRDGFDLNAPGIVPTALPPGFSPLVCDFERDLLIRINQPQITTEETLFVTGLVRNPLATTAAVILQDPFDTARFQQTLATFEDLPPEESVLIQINGRDFPPGRYDVRLRILDRNQETLAECGVPFDIVAGQRATASDTPTPTPFPTQVQ